MRRIIRIISLVLFCGYLIIGIFIHPHYGVPIDEYSQIDLGRVNYERIRYGSGEIQEHYDRHYGPAFEIPLYVLGRLAANITGADGMAVRHGSVFMFFALSLVSFYLLAERLYGHPGYGLLGTVLLALYPRFFAESFYNSKDMVFVAITIHSLLFFSFYRGKTVIPLLVAASLTGFGIAVRAQGLLLLGIYTLAVMGWGYGTPKKRIVHAAVFMAVAVGVAWASFPLFWNNFWENIIGFWRVSANQIGVATYYFGKFYVSPDIPWHYHFVWIGISAMLSVVVLSLFGVTAFLSQSILHKRKITPIFVALFGIVAGTLAVSVGMHPRSYDGWRHIYYVYPALITFAIFPIHCLFEAKHRVAVRIAIGCVTFLLIDVLSAAIFLLKNHPRQYVYFNMLAGGYRQAKSQFDFDYWGISLKETHAYLTTLDMQKHPRIYFDQILPYTEYSMIPSLVQNGAVLTDTPDDADIYVAVFRDRKEPPSAENFEKIFAVTVHGADLSAVFKRK
jgi:hypothetical protein